MSKNIRTLSWLAVAGILASTAFITTSINAEESVFDKLQMAEHHGGNHEGKKYKHRHKNMMKKMDTDGDGKVSRDEFMKHAEDKFARKDANGDGFISEEEHNQCHRHKKGKSKQEA